MTTTPPVQRCPRCGKRKPEGPAYDWRVVAGQLICPSCFVNQALPLSELRHRGRR